MEIGLQTPNKWWGWVKLSRVCTFEVAGVTHVFQHKWDWYRDKRQRNMCRGRSQMSLSQLILLRIKDQFFAFCKWPAIMRNEAWGMKIRGLEWKRTTMDSQVGSLGIALFSSIGAGHCTYCYWMLLNLIGNWIEAIWLWAGWTSWYHIISWFLLVIAWWNHPSTKLARQLPCMVPVAKWYGPISYWQYSLWSNPCLPSQVLMALLGSLAVLLISHFTRWRKRPCTILTALRNLRGPLAPWKCKWPPWQATASPSDASDGPWGIWRTATRVFPQIKLQAQRSK